MQPVGESDAFGKFADDDDDLDTLFGDGGDDVLRVETNDLGAGRQIDD